MNRQKINQSSAKINVALATFEGRKINHGCRISNDANPGACCYSDDSKCSKKQGKLCMHYWSGNIPNYTNNIRPTTLLAIRKGFELNVNIAQGIIVVSIIVVSIDEKITIRLNTKNFKDVDDAESYARALALSGALEKA